MPSASINFDLLARDRASDKFQKIGKSADGTKSKMAALAKIGKVGMVALATGATAAAGGIGLMIKAAVDDQKSQSKLAQTLKNTTGATKQQIAGVEDWITAQGKAFGVADDDLRPALDKLAVATGSVGKSQQLASLAMDVSAGTGKDLGAVSAALAKAYNGNVGALGRLGIATKGADGKTKSFAQIQADLAQKFKGQAATAADTFAGRMGRLKLALSEAGESIGYKLLPIAERLAVWFVNKGLPAIDSFVSFVGAKFGPVLSRIRTVVAGQIIPAINGFIGQMRSGEGAGGKLAATLQKVASTLGSVFTWISNNKTTVATFVGVVGTAVAIAKAWAAAQWAINIAMTANPIGLVVVAIAGLAAGLVYAYKHSEKFRAIVTGAFAAVKASASAVAGFFTSTIPAAFGKVKNAASTAINWVKGHWPLLLGVLAGPFGLAAVLIARHWSGIVSGARSAIGKVTSFFQSLPGKILGAVGNLGSLLLGAGRAVVTGLRNGISGYWSKVNSLLGGIPGKIVGAVGNLGSVLYNAGTAVIQGLINGVTSRIGALTTKLHEITNLIPKHKGPRSKDKVLLTPAGEAIMEGLLNGIKKKWTPVKDFLQKITDKVAEKNDKLKELVSQRNDFAAGFQSFGSSIFGRDTGQDENGNAIPESVSGIKAFATAQQKQAQQLANDVKRLVGLGLSKDLLAQLQQGGSSGLAQIRALASGASRADIASLNNSNKAKSDALNAAGMSAANAIYGGQIAQAKAESAEMVKVLRELRDELRADGKKELHAEVRGDHLVFVIQKDRQKRGKKDPFK